MRQCGFLGLCVSLGALLLWGCGSSSGGGSGGMSGGTGGNGGTGATPGTGGGTGFMAVDPCAAESAYTTTGTTVTFGAAGAVYEPKCLKVAAGATVTFSGDFTAHPLEPSANRGTRPGSPITVTGNGTTKAFTFPTVGYYAYFCSIHGPSDGAAGMVGVIWVE